MITGVLEGTIATVRRQLTGEKVNVLLRLWVDPVLSITGASDLGTSRFRKPYKQRHSASPMTRIDV